MVIEGLLKTPLGGPTKSAVVKFCVGASFVRKQFLYYKISKQIFNVIG